MDSKRISAYVLKEINIAINQQMFPADYLKGLHQLNESILSGNKDRIKGHLMELVELEAQEMQKKEFSLLLIDLNYYGQEEKKGTISEDRFDEKYKSINENMSLLISKKINQYSLSKEK